MATITGRKKVGTNNRGRPPARSPVTEIVVGVSDEGEPFVRVVYSTEKSGDVAQVVRMSADDAERVGRELSNAAEWSRSLG